MKKAKIYIRGLQKPITVSAELGNDLQKMKEKEGEYKEYKDTDYVEVDGVDGFWSGEVKDLRSIFFEKEERMASGRKSELYSLQELDKIEKEMEEYCMEINDDEYIRIGKEITSEILDDELLEIGRSPWVKERTEKAREKIKNLSKEEREKEAKKESVKILKDFMVGKWRIDSEKRFLEDKGVIKIESDGEMTILDPQKYSELSDKLSQCSLRIGQREFEKRRNIEQDKEVEDKIKDEK